MTRTKKKTPRDCRRHGDKTCGYCVANRTYNKRKTEEHAELDEKEFEKGEDEGQMKIYVASSWRNTDQPAVVEALRKAGHEVYDFRNPKPGNHGFHWSDIDPRWKGWSRAEFARALNHDIAKGGFALDFEAMEWADAFILVMPCGRSAHLELGWACGAGKKTYILLSDGEPELMYKLVDYVACSLQQLLQALEVDAVVRPA